MAGHPNLNSSGGIARAKHLKSVRLKSGCLPVPLRLEGCPDG